MLWLGAWTYTKKCPLEKGVKRDHVLLRPCERDAVEIPLKDTAGPSLHILIKLENILAITLLPLFITYALVQ